MFGSKIDRTVMIIVGVALIGFGVYGPDSFLPPVVNLILGIITVISNSVFLGMLLADNEEEI